MTIKNFLDGFDASLLEFGDKFVNVSHLATSDPFRWFCHFEGFELRGIVDG